MKNNVVRGLQPWDWKRTRESSFRHRGMTRVSAKKSEQNIHPNFLGCADYDARSDFTRCTHCFCTELIPRRAVVERSHALRLHLCPLTCKVLARIFVPIITRLLWFPFFPFIMDETFGMATNEQAGWKKRKTLNLAISHEASTASSTPVASSRSSRNKQAGTRGPGVQGKLHIWKM